MGVWEFMEWRPNGAMSIVDILCATITMLLLVYIAANVL